MMKRRRKSSYSAAARKFVSSEIGKLVERGYSQAEAIAASLSSARRKGYKVPAARNVATWALGFGEQSAPKKKRVRSRRARANPGVVIGDTAIDLRYVGGQGKRKGQMRGPWKHQFESEDVQVIGKKDGSVLLRSKSGERLWDHFEV
jgi:hypothetical protein